jgi:hypothetical protein
MRTVTKTCVLSLLGVPRLPGVPRLLGVPRLPGGLLLLGVLSSAAVAHGHAYWNEIRHSAGLPEGRIEIRMENPGNGGTQNYLLYPGTGVEEVAMDLIPDGPSTLAATAPGPVDEPRPYGFRLIQGDAIDVMPVRIADGLWPAPEQLTRLATDPAGDELFGYEHLDLVDCRVSFSGDQLHASLTNVGGGYPVSQGLSFFGYLLGIVDPAQADPDTVFALMYTFEQAGIISPGLYKVTGTGLGDLQRLGDVVIEEFPASNSLRLSCQLGDLTGDPYFQSWFDPADPTLDVAGFTQRITLLGGVREADRTPGGRMYLREFFVEPGENALPAISDPAFEGAGAEAVARIDYLDPDGHCPVLAELVFDGIHSYPLYPETLDYGQTVTYTTSPGIEPLVQGGWATAVFRFSDNQVDVVECETGPTAVEEGRAIRHPGRLVLSVSPNPLTRAATVQLDLPQTGRTRVAVFDAAGALVRMLINDELPAGLTTLRWDGRDRAGRVAEAGVYFLEASVPGGVAARRIVVLN